MNKDIQNSLFETMKIFSDNAKNTSNAAHIIEGTITAIVDAGLGEYTVEYLGNTFSVFANNLNVSYSVGDNVYIAIPENDFSKVKTIIGLTNPSINTFIDDGDLQNIYYEISDNLIDRDFDTIKMSSYDTTRVENIPVTGFSSVNYARLLNEYAAGGRTFKLGFSAMTSLAVEQQNSGNYGIMLRVPVVVNAAAGQGSTEVVWKEYTLDVTNMIGNYYRFEQWSPQQIYFTLDEQYIIADNVVPTLSYYCYDFAQDSSKTDIQDIWIKDIELKAVDVLSIDETSGLGLTLKATEGTYFSNYYRSVKTLTPTLRVNGKVTLLKIDNCEVYWFKEDAGVKPSSIEYCVYGGAGWKCLNKRTDVVANDDGTETFNWDTSALMLDVSQLEVPASARYKCVVIYKEKQASSIIELKNLASISSFDLKSASGSNMFLKDTGYVHLIATVAIEGITDKSDHRNDVFCAWLRSDKNGNIITDQDSFFQPIRINELIENAYVTEVRFPVNAIEEMNTVYCTVKYIKDDLIEELIGTRELFLSTSVDFNYNVIINNDDIIYKYDSNGDSPTGMAYDGPSTSKVTSIRPLTYTIRKANGEEFTGEEYCYVKYCWTVPKKSLFSVTGATRADDNNYYFEGYDNYSHTASALPYSIASRYNVSRANAEISLRIEFQNIIVDRVVSVGFIKEGENGSNGTAYAARLVAGSLSASTSVPYGTLNARGVAQKLKFCYNTSNGVLYYYNIDNDTLINWSSTQRRIFPQVFENSELLIYNSHYRIEYSMFDDKVTNPCFYVANVDGNGGVLLQLSQTPIIGNRYCNILQAKITVTRGNSSVANSSEVIYAYYPIELTVMNFAGTVIPSLDGGFAEVMYASDGTNPSWDQTSDFIVNDDKLLQSDVGELNQYFGISWEANGHLTASPSGNRCVVRPHNKYDDGNSKCYVAVRMSLSGSAAAAIRARIASLQSQNAEYQARITAASAAITYLNSFAFDYHGKPWNNQLDYIQQLFDRQTNAVNKLNILSNSSLVSIDNYINMQASMGKPVGTVCQTLINQLTLLQQEVQKAVVQIKTLDGTSGHNFDDLIALANYSIDWNQSIKEAYASALGLDTAINFELMVNDINSQIIEYDSSLEQLKEVNHTFTTLYREIIADIQYMCDDIPSNAYSQYRLMRDRVLTYVDAFATCTSIKDIKRYIELMYERALKNTFDLNNGVLSLNANTRRELLTIQSDNQALITKNNITIQGLNSILTNTGTIEHTRPIVMYFNRYEMSNINAWDGNKIETGDGHYLLAPQVGAGIKESDNSFTGIVIGQRNIDGGVGTGVTAQVGLFGYGKGQQSIFLNAGNGSAVLGKAGNGQIVIDPSTAKGLLYSGNYFTSINKNTGLPSNYNSKTGNGMCIDLGEGIVHLASADKGVMYSGQHSELTSKKDGFYISQYGLSLGSKFKATSDGQVRVGNGATTNTSKHWIIDGNDNSSYIGFNAVAFDSSNLGDKDNYRIGGYLNQVYIGTDGIRLGNKFAVDADGNAVVKNLIAREGGSIGGWTINRNSLTASGITIDAGGSISARGWSINASGDAKFDDLTANGTGEIGGWTITSSGLESNGISISSNGSISCGSSWNISSNGTATFQTLYASNQGTIGGWTIGPTSLTGSGITLGTGKITGTGFELDNNGMKCTQGNVTGNTNIALGGTGEGANGISYNGNKCTISGDIYANNGHFNGKITATSGSIGGINIGSGISGSGWSLTSSGGTIGGWTITSSGLDQGKIHIWSNGVIVCTSISTSDDIRASGNVTGKKLYYNDGGKDVGAEIENLWEAINDRPTYSDMHDYHTSTGCGGSHDSGNDD